MCLICKVIVTHNRPAIPLKPDGFGGFPHKTCEINDFSTHNRPEHLFSHLGRVHA